MDAGIDSLRTAVDARLAAVLPEPSVGPARLMDAMRYSVLAPAKRVRPLLTLLAAEQLGGSALAALDPAVAVELVHAASLVLDDLPSMDDARERRGRPANHLVYGEDTAILAGVALLNQAYQVLAGAPLPEGVRVRAVTVLSDAVGVDGLTGGQEFDLKAVDGADIGPEDVERTYRLKTAVLFGAAAELGGLSVGGSPTETASLRRFGIRMGLAFQAFDDLLDAHATAATVGKDVGQDAGKPTFVSLLGRDRTESYARNLVDQALQDLAQSGGRDTRLATFALALVGRMTAPLSRSPA
jgi:geranylgeranyl diphosphate synthase type II